MFAPHWSAFLEGNYMDFGSNSGTVAAIPVTVKANETTVLLGVNYHFF
jgi:opacity protein-like surface antigen